MSQIEDHPLRYALANELHARPFPALKAPCRAAYLAIKMPSNAAARDRDIDRAHLIALLDRFGAPHPQPGATHWFGEIGRFQLKWESHTEFVTYTIFADGVSEKPFDASTFDVFPEDWLAEAPGVRVTSALIRVEALTDESTLGPKLDEWFVPESLAASSVIDEEAVIAGDFRIDPGGHMRFAVFAKPGIGGRRLGRIVQRLCEIETYKSMSMLGLARVRAISGEIGDLDRKLAALMSEMTGDGAAPEHTLEGLLAISSKLEQLAADSSFRFGATNAYEAIVNQRIEVLREQRYSGRQTFAEFMMRRFDPAMRTVKATEGRITTLSDRSIRGSDLLRTRVDVDRSAQNQKLLESMDQRADLQLQLQRTVEGLSVVAISYYAVNLVIYVLSPVGTEVGVSRLVLTALVTPLVIGAVWLLVRRIRQSMEK
ncbi:MAG: DUF3422 domain-containing protein [Pseudomonadota bacterium]